MSKPVAVVISDIHFSVANLEIASQALKAAITKAKDLDVPLIIAGDLQDTKAVIRAEVANRLIDLISDTIVNFYVIVGNHDLVNEKGTTNALEYLRPYVNIINAPNCDAISGVQMIPYYSDADALKSYLKTVPTGSTLIMHQGFLGAAMGDYIQDKTSISPELVKDYTVISGHYHRHQTLGTVTYIGSPYTVTFGEANDGPKGFLVLNQDGTFTREILNLRKHVVVNITLNAPYNLPQINQDDLVWVKVSGPASELQKINKKDLGAKLGLTSYRLELLPTQVDTKPEVCQHIKPEELLDALIDNLAESDKFKSSIKALWKEIA